MKPDILHSPLFRILPPGLLLLSLIISAGFITLTYSSWTEAERQNRRSQYQASASALQRSLDKGTYGQVQWASGFQSDQQSRQRLQAYWWSVENR